MLQKLLVRGARQLLTLKGPTGPRRGDYLGSIGVIADGAVLISGETIAAVGSSRQVENLAEARFAHEISASGRVVMPAFVDSFVIPFRPHPEQKKAFSGWPEQQARRIVKHCVAHGTTTLEARIPLDVREGKHVKTLRMMKGLNEAARLCLNVMLRRPEEEIEPTASGMPASIDQMLTRVKEKKLAEGVSIFCGPNHYTVPQTKAILDRCAKLGLRRKVFASEEWVDGCIGMAVTCGVECVEGLNHATENHARALRDGMTMATIFPAEAYTKTRTAAPARMLADFGVPICLASGANRDSQGTFSMQAAICEAVRSMGLTAEEAITGATINAAHAVGLETRIGSIEFGKEANLLLLDTSDYRDLTQYYGVNLTGMCIQRGEVVYRRQELSWP